MKTFIIVMLIILILILGYTFFSYSVKFGQLEGQVYVSPKEIDIELIKDAPVFLIRNAIFDKIDELEMKYKENFGNLISRFQKLNKEVSKRKDTFRENKVKLEALKKLSKDKRKYYESQIESLSKNVNENKKIFYRYESLKDSVNIINMEYNKAIEEYIDNFLYLKTKTNSLGAFKFKKVEDGRYMLYCVIGKLFNKHIWMLKVKVEGNKRINLKPENEYSYFK